MDDFVAVNAIYSRFFGEHKPARSAVQVARLPLNALFEIECIARSVERLVWSAVQASHCEITVSSKGLCPKCIISAVNNKVQIV